MFTESYIYKKEIDFSVFNHGFHIRNESQKLFLEQMESFLAPGEKKKIYLAMDGVTYEAEIKNEGFDKKFREGHPTDIIRVLYSKNSDIAKALREKFAATNAFIEQERAKIDKAGKKYVPIPEDQKEYLAIYTTEYADTYALEPIFSDEIAEVRREVSNRDEFQVEHELSSPEIAVDTNADLVEKQRTVRIRKLNRLIGENLKLLYGYRCQLCGQLIGEEFGSHIAEAHHIEYFVKSLNNDAANQMIVCPNHHRIIHDANPTFIRAKKKYVFPNGSEARLVLNQHL